MPRQASRLPETLDALESYYGDQQPSWPIDPYLFLVWWHCGYPPSEAACAKGWSALNTEIGVELWQLLSASDRKLRTALKAGGLIPELRAKRLKEIAARVQEEFGGDLRGPGWSHYSGS